MKRIASFLILLALTLSLAAQNISVASFNLDEKDLTANLAGTSVEDQNGQKCGRRGNSPWIAPPPNQIS